MSKVTLNNITGGYAAVDLLNENFDAIEAAFENTLSRNGAVPNTWLANQDANHKRLINLADPIDDKDAANKEYVINAVVDATPIAFAKAAYYIDRFTGDGSDTTFTLTAAPGLGTNSQVYINGAYQNKNTYSVSGTTLTFTEAPPNNSDIEVVVVQPVAAEVNAASNITIADAGNYYTSGYVEGALQEAGSYLKDSTQDITGAVPRTLPAKLADMVSVKDFGAVGDGVTDDTTSIQDALTYAGTLNGADVWFPPGQYKVTSTLTVPTLVRLQGDSKLEGGASRLISETASNIFYAPSAYGSAYAFFDIRNMSIQGKRDGVQQFLQLDLGVSWGWSTVEGCYLVNIPKFDLLITGVHFINNNFQNICQLQLRGADGNLRDNYIGYDALDTIMSETDGLVVIRAAGSWMLTDNYISSFPTAPQTEAPRPIVVDNSSQINLMGNRFDGGTQYSVVVEGGAFQIVITNNRIASISSTYPVKFSNVSQVVFNNNMIDNLTSSQPFAGCDSTQVDIVVRDNLTNTRTDTTVHDFSDDSVVGASRITLVSQDLNSKNFTTTLDFSTIYLNRVLTNTGGTGTQTLYIQSQYFLPTDMFYFKNTATRLIIYDVTTSTTIYDSSTAGYQTGKVMCFVAGTVVVSSV